MAATGKLTKAGLARHLAGKLGYTKKDALLLVSAFFRSMAGALKSGEGIELRGFGSFRVRSRASRMGRNPRNGQPVYVPQKQVVHFKIGRDLRSRLVKPKDAGGGADAGAPQGGAAAGAANAPEGRGGMAESGGGQPPSGE